MKAIYLISVFALTVANVSYAQDNLRLLLKDGSEMVGYISSQRPGNSFTFTSKSAVMLVDSDEVLSVTDTLVSADELSEAWKTWARENNAFERTTHGPSVRFCNVATTDSGIVRQVLVTERGAKIKYIDFSERVHNLPWGSVSSIKAPVRSSLVLSGINRKYVLSTGMEYSGQYVEEIPGQTLSLRLDNGMIMVFNRSDVVCDIRYKINPDQSIFEQSDLVDIVRLEDGTLHRGIITERNYAAEGKKSYLTLQEESGSSRRILLSDVAEYIKEPNPSYSPIEDILVEEGTYMVNRRPANPIGFSNTAFPTGNLLSFDVENIDIHIPYEENGVDIIVETSFSDDEQAYLLKLAKVEKYTVNKKMYYGFTYEHIAKRAMSPVRIEKSANGTTKLIYSVGSSGTYAIYNPQNRIVILFVIE